MEVFGYCADLSKLVFGVTPREDLLLSYLPLFFLRLVRGVERSERGQSPPIVSDTSSN